MLKIPESFNCLCEVLKFVNVSSLTQDVHFIISFYFQFFFKFKPVWSPWKIIFVEYYICFAHLLFCQVPLQPHTCVCFLIYTNFVLQSMVSSNLLFYSIVLAFLFPPPFSFCFFCFIYFKFKLENTLDRRTSFEKFTRNVVSLLPRKTSKPDGTSFSPSPHWSLLSRLLL